MNRGWRYESARHSLAARGIKTGRKYNFDVSAFKESIRGLGLGRQIVRPEMMQRYSRALNPSAGVRVVKVSAMPVNQIQLKKVEPPKAEGGQVQTVQSVEVVKAVPTKTLSSYDELRQLGKSIKFSNRMISAQREKLSHISGKKSYGARAPPIVESLRQEELKLQSIFDTYTPDTIQRAIAAAPKDY